MERALKIKGVVLLLLCSLSWGPAYLFIKIAVPEIPPITLVFLRVGIAWAILYPVCLIQTRRSFDWMRYWKQYLILAVTLNALPFCLVSFGELYISSALAGILYTFLLIFTAILGHFFGSHDPLTKNKIIGISLGIAGLVTIYLPLVYQESMSNGIGAFFVIVACLSSAIGTVYIRTHLQNMPGMILLTAQLGVSALILLPLSVLMDRPYALPFPSFQSMIGVLGLSVVCTVAAYLLYYKTIQFAGSTYASFSVLLIPIFAMIFGSWILHEQLTWNLYVGTPLILSGVLAVNPVFNKK